MDAAAPTYPVAAVAPLSTPVSTVRKWRVPTAGPQLLESCGTMWVVRRTAESAVAHESQCDTNPASSCPAGVKTPNKMSQSNFGFTDVFMLHGSSEPISTTIDVTTGHLILSYMEAYLREDSRMSADWEAVNAYEAEEATPCVDAQRPENLMKNRLIAPLPYEQSRVRLRCSKNDYINASLIYDHTPRNPMYIATPTPLLDTLADFWQMIWEQSSVVIVCLERPAELKPYTEQLLLDSSSSNNLADECIQYWPTEGTYAYGNFEVHLVSEHSSSDKFIVRSLYLKNLQTAETRTVTQFHYLTWNDEKLKAETKWLLDFRRKVNRSFRGMMSPIVVHCSDGSSRTGTYVLLDLVLNRIAKGVKEVNIAATLEHLRDQRQGMVRRKEQYEFVFTAVAHEVDMMLKMSSQSG